jgi:hypothetical protein
MTSLSTGGANVYTCAQAPPWPITLTSSATSTAQQEVLRPVPQLRMVILVNLRRPPFDLRLARIVTRRRSQLLNDFFANPTQHSTDESHTNAIGYLPPAEPATQVRERLRGNRSSR